MGFPSVLERIAKALGLYPKNDPNNRNIPQGIGQQQPRNGETPIQEHSNQRYGRSNNPFVGAGSVQDAWRQPYETAQQQGNAVGNQQQHQTAGRLDNIVRMPDRDGREPYAREAPNGAYQQEASGRNMAGREAAGFDPYGRETAGRDTYNREPYGREAQNSGSYGREPYSREGGREKTGRDPRDSYGQEPYGRDRDVYGRDPYGNDLYGRDPYAQPAPQMMYAPSTIIFCVRRKEDSSEIINYLLAGLNVILTFEDVDDVQCQRVLDFVGGAAFALEGSVEKISYRNYFVAPRGAAVVRSESQVRNHLREASAGYYSRY